MGDRLRVIQVSCDQHHTPVLTFLAEVYAFDFFCGDRRDKEPIYSVFYQRAWIGARPDDAALGQGERELFLRFA